MNTRKVLRRTSIRKRIRKTIRGTAEFPRLSVFRSNKQIYAQIIDDVAGTTMVAASSRELKGVKAKKSEIAGMVGKAIAEKATAAGISKVMFDRGGYLYHGRVKSLADAAREGGLKF
ncbi:MAG TPA: 50S ribosomal protein L18 [Bacteroidia bacterium]|nr:50S ribosomal protein L18 [Bacteroidia bacterium]